MKSGLYQNAKYSGYTGAFWKIVAVLCICPQFGRTRRCAPTKNVLPGFEPSLKRVFSGVVILLHAAPAFAASADSTAVAMSAMPDATGLVVRMVLSLGIVLMLIWGAVYLLQRLSGKNGAPGGGNTSHIRVLDRAYLAPKKAVYVLQIGSRTLAVGVTDAQISPLAELDPEETRAAYPPLPARNNIPSFANLLKDVRAKFSGGLPS